MTLAASTHTLLRLTHEPRNARMRKTCQGACAWLRVIFFALSAGLMALAQAQTAPVAFDPLPVPKLTAQITDQTGTLSPAEIATLTATASGIAQARGSQIAVLIVASTNGEPIEDFAHRVGDSWKLGRKGVGDGVLLVAALKDRKIRIDVARALEGAIPDAVAKRIIRETMAPQFKEGRIAAGLDAALHKLDERLAGEVGLPSPSETANNPNAMGASIEDMLPFVIMAVFVGFALRSMFGGFIGSTVAGAGAGFVGWNMGLAVALAGGLGGIVLLIVLIFGGMSSSGMRGVGGGIPFPNRGGSNHGWGGGTFGGGSGGGFGGGGGFSSGGGGDFGGGGASGDW